MTLGVVPVFIPIHHGNHGPVTKEEINLFIGIWIVCNILWVLGWIWSIIRTKYRNNYDYFEILGIKRYEFAIIFADLLMGIVWAIIGITYLGKLISGYL